MSKTEQIAFLYEHQKKYGFWEKINLYRDVSSECGAYNLEIVLSEYPFEWNATKLVLLFTEVKQLEMGDINNLFQLVISIDDIRQFQMERIGYAVREIEYDCFSFMCNDFIIELRNRLDYDK